MLQKPSKLKIALGVLSAVLGLGLQIVQGLQNKDAAVEAARDETRKWLEEHGTTGDETEGKEDEPN